MSCCPLSKVLLAVSLGAIAAGLLWTASAREPLTPQEHPVGYDDTPYLPGGEWRVHDKDRPVPEVVAPGLASSAQSPGQPPADAIVLFDGKDLSPWLKGDGKPAQWKVENGCLKVNGTGSIQTRDSFGDCQLHVEFATPAEVQGESQGRGNSGVFLMNRYEIQVLDSYKNRSYADGQCAAMYGQYPPLVNACRAPGEWQTYDILFRAPRFAGDELTEPATLTLLHNGVVVHSNRAFQGATTHRNTAGYSPHAPEGPIQLQDHGNPVRYRNIWVRPLRD